jgi:hypothetical protein
MRKRGVIAVMCCVTCRLRQLWLKFLIPPFFHAFWTLADGDDPFFLFRVAKFFATIFLLQYCNVLF